MEMTEEEHEPFREAISRCIKGLVEKFEESPHFFYKESDSKCYLYHLLISEGQFKEWYNTKDEKKTCLVHTEYPSYGNLPIDLVILDPQGFDTRAFKKQRIACAIELKFWDSAGYDPDGERNLREKIVGSGTISFIVYLARGNIDGWNFFKSKLGEFKAKNEEILLESTKRMALVTRIRPET